VSAPSAGAPPPAPKPAASVARPEGNTDFLSHHEAPIAAGTDIVVDDGDVFVGLSSGAVAGIFQPGRTPASHDMTSGTFLRQRFNGVRFGGPLGNKIDSKHARADVTVFGEFGLVVADPGALVLAAPGASSDQVVNFAKADVLKALGDALDEALGKGDVQLIGLVLHRVLADAAARYEASKRLPGTKIDIGNAQANVKDLVKPPAAGPPQPQGFVQGSEVLVQWSDGNRYPGTVAQASGDRCLVVFPNGTQDWIPIAYLTAR
jgi:hypothetical protein